MTLILGLACQDGVVMAADSQGTTAGMGQPPMRTVEEKLYQLHEAPVVVGCSGAVGVAQNIRTALEGMKKDVVKKPVANARSNYRSTISKVLKVAQQSHVDIDKTMGPPLCDTLIAGYAAGAACLLEVNRNGGDEQHEHRGFCALGGGGPFAHFACASMQHHAVRELGMRAALALAYRTIETAIEVAAYGLGGPVQLWVIDSDGARKVEGRALDVVRDTANTWKKLETEFLASAIELQT